MSVNTSSTPDGRGVLIYNGEMILLYTEEVNCHFENGTDNIFRGNKSGNLYLTSHRVIFINRKNDSLRSFSMPFHCMKDVKLEQPVFGANFLKGIAIAQPGGNWNGEVTWKLTFSKGGCIDFGMAMLKAVDMAQRFRPHGAPPAYAPPTGNYFSAPPAYYIPPGGNYNGFQAPINTFPNHPPAGDVYMYEAPPPYSGIGPDHSPIPAGQLQGHGIPPSAPQQPMYAPPLPTKSAVVAMHAMSMYGSDQQDAVATDSGFIANNIIISDYDHACQNSILNNVTVEGNKLNESGNYQTVYSEYQPLVGSSIGMTTSSIPPVSASASYQQLNEMSPQPTAASASQFDHITVMTNLQHQPDLYTGIPVSSVSNGIAYTIPNSTNTAALQIYPPSAITQQVQQSVPALNAVPRRSYPSLLPVTGRGSNRQVANISVVSDDGPTVRQHLQQQHRTRLQQQLALQEKAKVDKCYIQNLLSLPAVNSVCVRIFLETHKDDLMTEYSGMLSSGVDKMLPVSTTMNLPSTGSANMLVSTPMNMPSTPSMNIPASPSMNVLSSPSMNIPASPSANVPASPSMNIPPSPSMNISRVSQMPRQQYIPRMAPQKPRIMTDRVRRMPMYENHAYQAAPSYCPQKQRVADIHEEAIQRAAAVYNQIRAQKYSPPSANSPQIRNMAFPRSPATTAVAETSVETVQKKSPARKRNHSTMSASQVRVTVLGTQSEPATQQIITESDQVLPIHGIAGPPKQSRIEVADAGPGKDGAPRSSDEKPPWQFARTTNSGSSISTSQTMEDCSKNDAVMDPSNTQKAFAIQMSNNSFSLPSTEPLLTEPNGSSTSGSELSMMSGTSELVPTQPMLAGNDNHLPDSLRDVMTHADDEVATYTHEAQYVRKLYFMKRLVESLVIKNGALCDEVSRLNQRIRTVMEERRVLAKRLQHHERNRIRRIQTKLKKQAAARASKTNESQSTPASTMSGTEGGLPAGDIENYESDDSDKTLVSSGAASPNTSASMSRVETPEPASRSQEFMSKIIADNNVVQESGKCKMKSGMRRQLSAKRTLTDRKEKRQSALGYYIVQH
ncbi:Postacrosomal sheath WW domain-binding protein [Dirofilaria immitis]|nr:Postacrosomal sheath WW domain-binding protein [Dirofilaria immitis]